MLASISLELVESYDNQEGMHYCWVLVVVGDNPYLSWLLIYRIISYNRLRY